MRTTLSVIVLVCVLFVFFTMPVQAVGDLGQGEKPSSAPIIVDRTDFPALYLNEPRMQGEAIWLLQARLRELGYEIEPNGLYDFNTSETIRLFKMANQLGTDGVVNRPVWETLMYEPDVKTCSTEEEQPKKVRIEIDVIKHTLTVFEDNKVSQTYPVGVGKSSTPSPLGEWKVVHKGVGWGNGFGTRWMGLNVPWGIYGIHGTNKPYSIGSSQSHGCIRMQNRDVEVLYPMIPVGTLVKIVEEGQIFPKNFKPVHLYRKCSGQKVVYVQSRLKEKGIIFDNADGRFGAMTELSLKYFQAWHCIEITGETNEETYQALGMINES
ncbi:MAG: peptidoglycan-binding protein [Bacillota bacterium]|nr:peptidoglycan-binding protein [Bacillota bacterium]